MAAPILPPPQYDHTPTIPVIEHVLTSDRVDAICQARHALGWDGRAPPPGYRFSGCAHVTPQSCEVWRIDDGTVRRHELGHCNGWPVDHPVEVKQATPVPAVVKPPVSSPPPPPKKEAAPVVQVPALRDVLRTNQGRLPTATFTRYREDADTPPARWSPASLAKPATGPLAPWPIRDADIDRVPLNALPAADTAPPPTAPLVPSVLPVIELLMKAR
jgi:hypothetical protein